MIELLLEAERALAGGQLERARQLYEQVAEADPRNAIAVVGLARVTEARDDALGAYLLARRALAIDPEDDAARRLASRLESGLAGGGDAVVSGGGLGAADSPGPTPGGMAEARTADIPPISASEASVDAASEVAASEAAAGSAAAAGSEAAAGSSVTPARPPGAFVPTGSDAARRPTATPPKRRSRLGRFLRLGR